MWSKNQHTLLVEVNVEISVSNPQKFQYLRVYFTFVYFRCQYYIRLLVVPCIEISSFIGISLTLALRLKMQFIQRPPMSPEINTNEHYDSTSESEQVINCGTFSPSSRTCPEYKICKSPVFTVMT